MPELKTIQAAGVIQGLSSNNATYIGTCGRDHRV